MNSILADNLQLRRRHKYRQNKHLQEKIDFTWRASTCEQPLALPDKRGHDVGKDYSQSEHVDPDHGVA